MSLILKSLSYHSLLFNVGIIFEPGFIYGVLGPNGAGKSTLLKTMAGIWTPTSGSILWKSKSLLGRPRLEISKIISLVPQNPSIQFDLTAGEMVALGRYCHGKSRVNREVVDQALSRVDANHLRHAPLSQLSGGERQRIYIARSLATEAPILLLDEPTSHLDLRHQIDIWRLLRSFADQGHIVITTIHDLRAASRYCDKISILNKGHCIAIGTYSDVMTPKRLKEVFKIQPEEL